jgi:hypothetical protein
VSRDTGVANGAEKSLIFLLKNLANGKSKIKNLDKILVFSFGNQENIRSDVSEQKTLRMHSLKTVKKL